MGKYRLVNITEMSVEKYIDQIMREEHCCECPICRLDIKALALNKLEPQYVVSERGEMFEAYRMNTAQSRAEVYRTILEAIYSVKENPHHEREAEEE